MNYLFIELFICLSTLFGMFSLLKSIFRLCIGIKKLLMMAEMAVQVQLPLSYHHSDLWCLFTFLKLKMPCLTEENVN